MSAKTLSDLRYEPFVFNCAHNDAPAMVANRIAGAFEQSAKLTLIFEENNKKVYIIGDNPTDESIDQLYLIWH